MIKNKRHTSKQILRGILLFIPLLMLSSCIEEIKYNDTPKDNFEALWKTLDEQYCFFDTKHVDWNAIHDKYEKKITPDMSDTGLFEVLGDMLAELQDGHVNLYAAHDVARYWKWYENNPPNFSPDIQKLYLGVNYRIASSIKYCVFQNNIGYIYYESFSDNIGDGNLDEVLNYLAMCDGLIIDVRDNGGGTITNASKLAARFTNEKVLTGYIRHKIGKGHNDFSDPFPIYLEPSKGVRWQKNAVVLTNRHCFSATNDFVNSMRNLPNVTIMGDQTGGGAGLPISSELPNGWSIRFSSSPHYAADMSSIEGSIMPDIAVSMKDDDYIKKIDSIIESAIVFLKK